MKASDLFRVAVSVLLTTGLFAVPAWAASENTDSNVTVTVDPSLSITAVTPNETITINGFASGDSAFKTISFDISGNNFSQSAIDDAVTAKLNTTVSGIDISVKNVAFVSDKSGIATLENATPANGVVLTTSAQTIAKKADSSGLGDNGKLVSGRLFVPTFATLTADSTARSADVTMTLTVKDQ